MVDENIAQIESRLKKHLKNPEKKAGRSIDRLGVDKSRDGEFFFKYELRFSNAAKRGVYDLQKYQEKRKKNGRQRERDDVARFEPAVPRRAPRGAGGILGRTVESEPEPDPSWLAESGMTLDTVVESSADATAPGAPSPAPESFEGTAGREANFTNEPNVDENVFLSQAQENDAVVADSEVVPGLDKVQTNPSGDRESGEAEISKTPSPFMGEGRVGVASPESQISNVDPSEPNEELGGGPAPSLSPRLPKRERRRQRKEKLRRAAERRLMVQLDKLPSEAARLEYLIKEMRANWPADVDALSPLGMPRAP